MSLKINDKDVKILLVDGNFISYLKWKNNQAVYKKSGKDIIRQSEHLYYGRLDTSGYDVKIITDKGSPMSICSKKYIYSDLFKFNFPDAKQTVLYNYLKAKNEDILIRYLNALTQEILFTITIHCVANRKGGVVCTVKCSGLINFSYGKDNGDEGFVLGDSEKPSSSFISVNFTNSNIEIYIRGKTGGQTYTVKGFNYGSNPVFRRLYFGGISASRLKTSLDVGYIVGYKEVDIT